MGRAPFAAWIGPTPNRTVNGMRRPILGLVLHIQQGTEAGSEAWLKNPKSKASAHFLNPRVGGLRQLVDTDDRAWAQASGNLNYVSVENEGRSGGTLNGNQLANLAQLMRWLHEVEDVPLILADKPGQRGLIWHGAGGKAWGGHPDCPGAPIVNQRGGILALAQRLDITPIPSSVTVSIPEGHDMAMVVIDPKTGADAEGRLPNWQADEDGNLYAWNGARPLKPLSAFATKHPPIVAMLLDESGDGVVLFGNDTRQENGHWVRSTYQILVGM